MVQVHHTSPILRRLGKACKEMESESKGKEMRKSHKSQPLFSGSEAYCPIWHTSVYRKYFFVITELTVEYCCNMREMPNEILFTFVHRSSKGQVTLSIYCHSQRIGVSMQV
jgi:hypothetical protein